MTTLFTWKHRFCFGLLPIIIPITHALLVWRFSFLGFVIVIYLPGALLAGYFILHRFLSGTRHSPTRAFIGGFFTTVCALPINVALILIIDHFFFHDLNLDDINVDGPIVGAIILLTFQTLLGLLPFSLLITFLDYIYFNHRVRSQKG